MSNRKIEPDYLKIQKNRTIDTLIA